MLLDGVQVFSNFPPPADPRVPYSGQPLFLCCHLLKDGPPPSPYLLILPDPVGSLEYAKIMLPSELQALGMGKETELLVLEEPAFFFFFSPPPLLRV